MKKKLTIEIKETSVNNADVWLTEKWTDKDKGVYLNSDEIGQQQLVLWDGLTVNMLHMSPAMTHVVGISQIDTAKEENNKDLKESVSETVFLKTVAIMQNPELSVQLLKSEK